jgi:hypothetical protein
MGSSGTPRAFRNRTQALILFEASFLITQSEDRIDPIHPVRIRLFILQQLRLTRNVE